MTHQHFPAPAMQRKPWSNFKADSADTSPDSTANRHAKTACGGIGLGAVLAALISWSVNKSMLWALVHGLLGWFYVLYVAMFH